MSDTILEIRHLRTSFLQDGGGELRAVDDLSYTVREGEFAAIIGESGSGKSVSALSILRLIPYPPGIIKGGEIVFRGRDLLKLTNAEMEDIRGKDISMVFQEPTTSLNPVLTIGDQITENILIHGAVNDANLSETDRVKYKGMPLKRRAYARAAELLSLMDIPNPDVRLRDYPFQFSGGMQQRAMIAMAMSCMPDLLICDEPTTALDVTIQAQVLEQLDQLRLRFGATLILITHNLGIVARYADTVKIMYGGKIVEDGPTDSVFETPRHPYTIGLIRAVPRLDFPRSRGLYTIDGEPPDMSALPQECCAFHSRCGYVKDECRVKRPELRQVGEEHFCACFNIEAPMDERKGALHW